MPRRTRRSGRLIQKKHRVKNPVNTFRVLAERNSDFWLEAEFNLFDEAKDFIDKIPANDINYYIHSENNRVLYSRKGI
jgi:putative SOS response-associated peptidase YedK